MERLADNHKRYRAQPDKSRGCTAGHQNETTWGENRLVVQQNDRRCKCKNEEPSTKIMTQSQPVKRCEVAPERRMNRNVHGPT